MSSIDDVGWVAGQGSVDDLNKHTTFHKPNFASFPSASSFPYNTFMMDDSTGEIYKNISGTWTKIQRSFLYEKSEASSTPVTDNAQNFLGDNYLWLGNLVTLPTTDKFYKITALECKNGTVVSGNFAMVALLMDKEPPTSPNIMIVAQTPVTAQSGTSSVQKVNTNHSLILAGGTSICGAILLNNATQTFRGVTISSSNVFKNGYTFPTTRGAPFDTTPWTADTIRAYVKIYYTPYGV